MTVAEKWRERQGVASLTLSFLLIFCEIFDFFAIFFYILNIERRFFGKTKFSKSFFSQKKKIQKYFFWWSVYIKSSSMLIFMVIGAFWPLRQRKNRQNQPKMQVIRSLAFWSSHGRWEQRDTTVVIHLSNHSLKDRSQILSTLSAEMKVEMPKIGARRFKYLQNTLLLCFYAFIMTEHHIFNHLEGHINRNGNEFLKHFAEISIFWLTTSLFRT